MVLTPNKAPPMVPLDSRSANTGSTQGAALPLGVFLKEWGGGVGLTSRLGHRYSRFDTWLLLSDGVRPTRQVWSDQEQIGW